MLERDRYIQKFSPAELVIFVQIGGEVPAENRVVLVRRFANEASTVGLSIERKAEAVAALRLLGVDANGCEVAA